MLLSEPYPESNNFEVKNRHRKIYKYYCITSVMDIITFRGNRDLWIDFIAKVKKNRKKVWEILEKFIRDYLKER